MAGRAVLRHADVESIDINTDGNVSMTFNAHYTIGEEEAWVETSLTIAWPGLTMSAFHAAIRDKIIEVQPGGYDLVPGDVLIPAFIKGSLL